MTSKRATANQREGLSVADSVSGNQFYLEGNSSSGALNVAITAGGGSGGTSSSFSSTFPATGTAIGATDGTNMQPLKVDGSDNLLVKVNAALPAGTNVIGHVIADTGSTTAVTGTVAVTESGTWNVGSSSGTGSAVPANAFYQGISDGTNLVGAKTAAAAANTTGTGLLGVGALIFDGTNYQNMRVANPTADGVTPSSVGLTTFSVNTVYNATSQDRQRSAANATNSTGTGITAAGVLAQLDDTSPTTITENQFGNLRLSADRSLLVTNRALTPTQTSVSVTNTSTSILVANNSRKGATIFNEGSAICYLKLGATASTTSYSVQMASLGYYEVPFGYVGAIDGITSASTAQLRITEIV